MDQQQGQLTIRDCIRSGFAIGRDAKMLRDSIAPHLRKTTGRDHGIGYRIYVILGDLTISMAQLEDKIAEINAIGRYL